MSKELPLREELELLLFYVKNYKTIYPYEQEYLLRRVSELVMQHKDFLGPVLTEQLLYATLVLTNSREDASASCSSPD